MALLVLAIAVLATVCFANAGLGMILVVVAGYVQDPLRKLAPGAPVAFVLIVLVLYGAVVAGLLFGGGFRPLQLSSVFRKLQSPFSLFLLVVAVQSVNSYFRSGSPALSAIGFVSYVAPALAGSVGFVMALKPERFLRILRVYTWWGLAAAATVLVARFIPDARILQPLGTGVMVYGENLGVRLATGILRTSEVAAWHAATTGCVLMILLTLGRKERRTRLPLAIGAAGIPIVILAVLWTGRRKALVEVAIFVIIFGILLLRLRGANRRLLGALAIGGGILAYQVIEGAWSADSSREASYLLERGRGTTSEGSTRLRGAISSVSIALQRNGVFGVGAGAAAQGTQYFGGSGQAGWEAEYGIGRLVTELGLPGLAALGWMLIRLLVVVRQGLRVLARYSPEKAKIAFGLAALLGANAAVFVTAAQIFGDPFVYLFLGTVAGGLGGLIEQAGRVVGEAPVVITVGQGALSR